MAALIGAVLLAALVALLYGIAAANPGGAAPMGTLVADDASVGSASRPERLVEWEGLLLAAATSGRRGRERLGRQMERLVAVAIADRHGMSLDDPRAGALLGADWDLLRGGPARDGQGTDTDAIAAAVVRLLERLEGPGPTSAS